MWPGYPASDLESQHPDRKDPLLFPAHHPACLDEARLMEGGRKCTQATIHKLPGACFIPHPTPGSQHMFLKTFTLPLMWTLLKTFKDPLGIVVQEWLRAP